MRSRKDEKLSSDDVQDLVIECLNAMDCCTLKDILYFSLDKGVELDLERIRYCLQSLEKCRSILRTKILRKNVYYLAKHGNDISSVFSFIEEQIMARFQKRLLLHRKEILSNFKERFHIGKDVVHQLLRRLSIEGKILYVFGVSYKGTIFRLYFLPENAKEIERQITRVKKYVSLKRLVFPDKNATTEFASFDTEDNAYQWIVMRFFDSKDFKHILCHLSYLGEVNQVYFIDGHPFAVPGQASEIKSMLGRKNDTSIKL